MSFKETKAAFIKRLHQLSASTDGVRELIELAPRLVRYESVNQASGRIDGKLTQINHAGGEPSDDSWATAEQLVAAIGDEELSRRFDGVHRAAKASPTRLNSVEGVIGRGGSVVQINTVHGSINW